MCVSVWKYLGAEAAAEVTSEAVTFAAESAGAAAAHRRSARAVAMTAPAPAEADMTGRGAIEAVAVATAAAREGEAATAGHCRRRAIILLRCVIPVMNLRRHLVMTAGAHHQATEMTEDRRHHGGTIAMMGRRHPGDRRPETTGVLRREAVYLLCLGIGRHDRQCEAAPHRTIASGLHHPEGALVPPIGTDLLPPLSSEVRRYPEVEAPHLPPSGTDLQDAEDRRHRRGTDHHRDIRPVATTEDLLHQDMILGNVAILPVANVSYSPHMKSNYYLARY